MKRFFALLLAFAAVLTVFANGFHIDSYAAGKIFCPECGQQIEEGSKFCMYCGTRVKYVEESKGSGTEKPAAEPPASAEKDAKALYESGMQYYNGTGGVTKNQAKAIELFIEAAEKGYVEAQYKLGTCYFYGYGVTKNEREGIRWYTKAATQGHMESIVKLGECYSLGSGVDKNPELAIQWYEKGAQMGDVEAMYGLASCYNDTNSAYKDKKKALEWFTKASELGSAKAAHAVGTFYEYGIEVSKDYKKALEWYLKAANQGDYFAQYTVGTFYEEGKGTAKDLKKAAEWYTKAAEGYSGAKTALEKLKGKEDDGRTYTTLAKGNSGTAVRQLQERLIKLGYLGGTADGDYGSKTADAVKEFCKGNGLTPTETATSEVQKKLFSESAKAYSEPYMSLVIKDGSYGQWNYLDNNKLSIRVEVTNVSRTKTVKAFEMYMYAVDVWGDRIYGSTTVYYATTNKSVGPGVTTYCDYMTIPDRNKIDKVYAKINKIIYIDGTVRENSSGEYSYWTIK